MASILTLQCVILKNQKKTVNVANRKKLPLQVIQLDVTNDRSVKAIDTITSE
jgi:hypothetical protein